MKLEVLSVALSGLLFLQITLTNGADSLVKTINPSNNKLDSYNQYRRRHDSLIKWSQERQNYTKGNQGKLEDDSRETPFDSNRTTEELSKVFNEEPDKENSQRVVLKREAPIRDDNFIHTEISRPGSPVQMTLVREKRTRFRRASFNYNPNWKNNIPYIIDPSFSNLGIYYVTLLKRALQWIMDRLCVTFIDETSRYNPSVPNWFTSNGYLVNGYVAIKFGTGCSADSGPGNGNQSRTVYPCQEIIINSHEMFHILNGVHTQQGAIGKRYISINKDNIQDSLVSTYDFYPESDNFYNTYFDPSSSLMYNWKTWSRNGDTTYTYIREDLFTSGMSTDNVVFQEMNRIYKCNELFCGNSTTNCGLGYYARVKGVCRCVCPENRDISTNCQTLKNGPSTVVVWPNTPIVLLAAGPSHSCPTGFNPTPGWFSFTGKFAATQSPPGPVPLPSSGTTHWTPVCVKPPPATIDWESWPIGGQYCMIKYPGSDCGGGFVDAGTEFASLAAVTYNGSLAETTFNGFNITQRYCCRYQEFSSISVDLPDAEPFRLFSKGTCPTIRGLKTTTARHNWWTGINREFGSTSSAWWLYSNAITTNICYYQPPTYGCNQLVTLNATNKSVTITTPGFPTAREPNRRCFYAFNVPAGSQLRLTFNSLDLSTVNDDAVLIRRYHQWQEPYKVDVNNWPYQLISEKDYLDIEIWTGYDTTTKKGVNFTVDVVLAEDFCYNASSYGADYIGNASISETYEPCLPWSKTVDCADFPSSEAEWLISSSNYCRNPASMKLSGPYCYTRVNGTNCEKRYCDVCNLKKPVDVIKKCAALIAADPTFCSTSVQRFGCFVSCNFTQPSTSRGTCGPPTIPSDGALVGTLKSSYNEGERVEVRCTKLNLTQANNVMLCTSSGWSTLTKACQECPLGWVTYGDRCFTYFTDNKTWNASRANCTTYGSSGTLFRVKDLTDQQMIRDYKTYVGSLIAAGNWISGRLTATTGPWVFTDTSIAMTYFNWTSTTIKNSLSYDCIKLIAEFEASNNQGGWKTLDCEGTHACPYMCQIDRNGVCANKLSFCDDLLAAFPNYCFHAKTVSGSDQYCVNSCGDCPGSPTCSTPSSTNYTRTSASATINPGQVMTFDCNPGYYYTSGDKVRACSSTGNLLGSELVCLAQPSPVDVNLNFVRKRVEVLPAKTALILDRDGYRVPFAGKISTWYYYSKTPGDLNFLVYRNNGTAYNYVGANSITSDGDYVWGWKVPVANQISVQANDIVGVFSTAANTLSVTDCNGAMELICVYPTTSANTLAELPSKVFSTTSCLCPSLGFRVNPA